MELQQGTEHKALCKDRSFLLQTEDQTADALLIRCIGLALWIHWRSS